MWHGLLRSSFPPATPAAAAAAALHHCVCDSQASHLDCFPVGWPLSYSRWLGCSIGGGVVVSVALPTVQL